MIGFFGNLTLKAHEIMIALLHDVLGHLSAHSGGRRSFFLGIGEYPHLIEALLFQKAPQGLILGVCLSRETYNKSGTNDRLGNTSANFVQKRLNHSPVVCPAHTVQHRIMGVLQGEINVFADLRLRRDGFDELIGKKAGIRIENPQPTHPFHLAEHPKQPGERGGPVEIAPVIRTVLCDEVDLLHARRCQPLHFRPNIFQGAAAVTPANKGNGTKSAAMVATFGDLHIGRIGGGSHDPRRPRIIDDLGRPRQNHPMPLPRLPHGLENPMPRPCADDGIRFWQLVQKLRRVPLPQAAGDDQRSTSAGLFILRHIEHGGNGFLLCRLDESTSVYH